MLKFLLCHNEFFERRTHKFFYVVFVGAVYRPSSMMVDYTDFEEERLREKKGKMFSPLHHLRPTTERRSIKRNFNNI